MKKLILAISIFGVMTSCGSNKHHSSSRNGNSGMAKTPTISPSKPEASRIPFKANEQTDPRLARFDSLLNDQEPRPHQRVNYYGASGAGTGGSYASNYYASRRYKKPAPKTQTASPVVDSTLTSQAGTPADSTTLNW
ncbi:MAG TPA: hypothetical protein VF691_04615 [Cytophagaceae bacterium]|jgi:hypothetical protein